MARSAPDSLPLAQHVQALYPLARVLVGGEQADALVRHVYENASAVPPAERPDDARTWLFQLMIETQDDALHTAGAEVTPSAEPSFTNDPFRREVAEQMAADKLPVAFAACSIHERFLLAIDALAAPSDEVLAAALDTSITRAGSVRDRARSALRASLRDVLTGPERMLVDVALPDDALRAQLRTLLTDRFQPVPPSLQSDVTEILEAARADRDNASADETNSWPPLAGALLSRRALLTLLGVLALTAAGLGAVSYLTDASPPSASVVELSVRRAPSLSVAEATSNHATAAEYIRRTWDRRLTVPTIADASLQGVGRTALADDSIPVLLYRDDDGGGRLAAFAFNYALLDALGERAVLSRKLRTRLASVDAVLSRNRPDQSVALWRQQDEIFVLVAPTGDADALRARIQR